MVHIARDKKLNFIVALKIMKKSALQQPNAQEQILREIKIQSYLNHPNILKLYGFFDDEEKIYLILEYAPWGELYSSLKKQENKCFTEKEAANYIKQVAEALVYMHSKDVIHRDIKPENLLNSFVFILNKLCDYFKGTIKICDFGWAVYAPNLLRETFCGTPDYVPPEMIKGDSYDQTVDIWSLGILCYEFLNGKPPFETKSQTTTFNNILTVTICVFIDIQGRSNLQKSYKF